LRRIRSWEAATALSVVRRSLLRDAVFSLQILNMVGLVIP
jgi:hypothetical protein